ncbi:hypothetical protein [Buttiauxella sp. 3AFRM03]|uniref:hypothetical protein n=1 Tax=Buttiauxella sp. 3AFRM03 TaxID=2479367 RepID=UPI0013900D1D|nr:hypothetical protein [Buttiauxella sp. 3AFRM03]
MFISRAHGDSLDRIVQSGKACRPGEKVRGVLSGWVLSGIRDAASFAPLRKCILINADESRSFSPCQADSFHWFPPSVKKPHAAAGYIWSLIGEITVNGSHIIHA